MTNFRFHVYVGCWPSAAAGPFLPTQPPPVKIQPGRSRRNFRSVAVRFSFSKIAQFPSKSAILRPVALIATANIH